MRYVLEVNRKRHLPFYFLLGMCLLLFLSSIYIIKEEQTFYLTKTFKEEISDGTEYRYLMEDRIYDSQAVKELVDKYDLPQNPFIREEIDISEFLIVKNINDLLSQGEKKEGEDFFAYRMSFLNDQYGEGRVKEMDSLKVGYCEGWKVLLRNFDKAFYFIGICMVFLILPIMSDDKRLKTEEMVQATFFGKKKLFRARIINSLEIGGLAYLIGIALFSFMVFLIYGMDGKDLLIQNSDEFFLFPFQVTYIQYFIYKIFNGFFLSIFVSIILLFLGEKIEALNVSFSILLAYVSIHFLLIELLASSPWKQALILSPLGLIDIEYINQGLGFKEMLLNYGLSLGLPLVLAGGLLWGFYHFKTKEF